MAQRRLGLSRQTRIMIVLCIDIVFFLVELIVGHMVNSLALIADSFHLLNDIISLVIGLYAIKLSKRTTHHDANTRYTYGWHRAEILAALVNGVFLLALSFSIFVDAMSRFAEKPDVDNPKLVVIVGCIGLASGLIGMFLFHEHGHGHDHGHSHGKREEQNHERSTSTTKAQDEKLDQGNADVDSHSQPDKRLESVHSPDDDAYFGHPAATRAYVVQTAREIEHEHELEYQQGAKYRDEDNSAEKTNTRSTSHPVHNNATLESATATKQPKQTSPGALNMHGLMLHVAGDALGNVGVITSGLVIWFAHGEWRFYMDPLASLVITAIIAFNTIPLVRSASYILLQCVPRGISLQDVGEAIRKVKGVQDVHELHIWQLSENKVVASVHVRVGKSEPEHNTLEKGKKAIKKHVFPAAKEIEYKRLGSIDGHDSNGDEKGDNFQISEVPVCPHALADVRDRDFMRVAAEIRRRLHDHGIHSSTIQPEYADEYEEVGDGKGAPRVRISRDGEKSGDVVMQKPGWFNRIVRGRRSDNGGDVEMATGRGDNIEVTPTSTLISSCLITCPPDQQECNPAENACCPPPKLVDV